MFRPRTTKLRIIARRWSARPLWAASLGILLTALIISGPLACFVHCAVVGVPHGGHHHIHHGEHLEATAASTIADSHPLLLANERGDHALCDTLMSQLSDSVPSALTIGVVLLTIVLPQPAAVIYRRLDLKPQLRLLALPPPPNPPRSAPSLIV